MAIPFRSSAGLMGACCLRSVPEHSTLLGDLRQLGTNELHPKERKANDYGEDREELKKVEEVVHESRYVSLVIRA